MANPKSILAAMLAVSSLHCARVPLAGEAAESRPLRFGADLHQHPTMSSSLPIYVGEPGSGVLADSPNQVFINAMDAEGLRRSGIRLVFASVFPPLERRPGRTDLGSAVEQLRRLKDFAQRRPDFALVDAPDDVEAVIGRGLIALVPTMEGAEAIGSVEDVDVLFAAGVRCLQLVHFTDNRIADAEDGQFGAVLGFFLGGEEGGLSELGRAAVGRMIELGILIDLSHSSDRTIRDVLELTEAAGVPVVYSHAGSAMARARTLEDELAARIAKSGGMIGIGVYRSDFLHAIPEAERWEGFEERTCDEVIAHWLHYRKVAGEAALVLGSDLGSPIDRPRAGGACPAGIRHAGDLPALMNALVAHGFSRDALDGMGERLVEVWRRADEKAQDAARERARGRTLPTDGLFDVPL